MRSGPGRPGFAAALALCMLVAVGGLAAASFHAVAEARRASHRGARQEEAAGAADLGLRRALDAWNIARLDSLAIGEIDSAGAPAPDGGRVIVTRITDRLFWLAAVGRAAPGTSVEATRAHHLLLEVLRPRLQARAALVSRGDVVVGVGTDLTGGDSPPPGWADCPATDTAGAPTVLVPEGRAARLETGDPISGARVDPLAGDRATYELLGGLPTASLGERADLTVAPGAIVSPAPDAATACRPGSPVAVSNWGEPTRAGDTPGCEDFYPVVHATGDLNVTGGRGQGVLIVDGRLRIEGPFTFAGVIVAFGGVSVTGADVVAYGAVLSAGGAVEWRAGGSLRRSTCAVERVSAAAAKLYPIRLRAWAELF